jgi:MerR family transcriptional regulator, mercuric resistance operon regulatory protein
MPPVTASRARLDGIPIGELSRLTGVNIETIRYYERVRMLRLPPRTEGGRRVYGPAEIRFRRCRELGFGLDAHCSPWAHPARPHGADVRQIAARNLDDIRSKIADLRKLERLLAKTIAQCSGNKVPECPVLNILDVWGGFLTSSVEGAKRHVG